MSSIASTHDLEIHQEGEGDSVGVLLCDHVEFAEEVADMQLNALETGKVAHLYHIATLRGCGEVFGNFL